MAITAYNGQAAVAASQITVWLAGTQQIATLYEDAIGTPLNNPFTADALTGLYQFYAEEQAYDVLVGQLGTPPSNRLRTLPAVIFSGTTPARVATLAVDDPISGDQIILSQIIY